jgi:hypothetical protein
VPPAARCGGGGRWWHGWGGPRQQGSRAASPRARNASCALPRAAGARRGAREAPNRTWGRKAACSALPARRRVRLARLEPRPKALPGTGWRPARLWRMRRNAAAPEIAIRA